MSERPASLQITGRKRPSITFNMMGIFLYFPLLLFIYTMEGVELLHAQGFGTQHFRRSSLKRVASESTHCPGDTFNFSSCQYKCPTGLTSALSLSSNANCEFFLAISKEFGINLWNFAMKVRPLTVFLKIDLVILKVQRFCTLNFIILLLCQYLYKDT